MNDVQLAALRLDLARIQELVERGADLSGTLLAACSSRERKECRQTELIEYLVSRGVSVDETDQNGVTPLHRAARFRSLAAARKLIELGASVDAVDRRNGTTALHRTTFNSGAPGTAGMADEAIEIAKLLILHGANASMKNKSGKTPLDYARGKAMQEVLSQYRETV